MQRLNQHTKRRTDDPSTPTQQTIHPRTDNDGTEPVMRGG